MSERRDFSKFKLQVPIYATYVFLANAYVFTVSVILNIVKVIEK